MKKYFSVNELKKEFESSKDPEEWLQKESTKDLITFYEIEDKIPAIKRADGDLYVNTKMLGDFIRWLDPGFLNDLRKLMSNPTNTTLYIHPDGTSEVIDWNKRLH